jgi:hypothetical protein
MNSRIAVLAFVSLLLTASLLGASPPPTANAAPEPEPALVATGLPEASNCTGNGFAEDLAVFAENSLPLSSDFNYCGSCGTDPCRGVLRGTVCGYDWNLQRQKRCEMRLGETCPGEDRVVCYCYAEDIP